MLKHHEKSDKISNIQYKYILCFLKEKTHYSKTLFINEPNSIINTSK